jgi:hypothetical protein
MERKPNTLGALASSWHSNDRYFLGPRDRTNTIIYGTPARENSLSYPDFGWSSTASGNWDAPITASSTYRPTNFSRYRTAWLGPSTVPRMAGIFKGTVGSSTLIRIQTSMGGNHDFTRNENFPLGTFTDGEHYFVAFWEMPLSVRDDFATWLTTGVQPNGSSNPPHHNYRILPWVYGG